MKVLILEDNEADAFLLEKVLVSYNSDIQVITCKYIQSARNELSSGQIFDLALLDMKLPDGSGLDFLIDLRKAIPSVLIIMLTGSGDEEVAVAALKAGADDYLVKRPGYQKTLAGLLPAALEKSQIRQKREERSIEVIYLKSDQADEQIDMHFKRYAPYLSLNCFHTTESLLKRVNQLINGPGKPVYFAILIDYPFPLVSVLDYVKYLRDNISQEMAVILIAGEADESFAVQALKLGASEYIVKRENYLFRLPTLIHALIERQELKLKQKELAASENKFRLLAENSADVIFVLDNQLHYTYISPSAKTLLGYEPEEVVRLDLHELITEASLKRTLEALGPTFSGARPDITQLKILKPIEIELIRNDKSTVWVEIQSSLLGEEPGEPSGILGSARDISERRRVLEEYRKLSCALEQSPVSIVITGLTGDIEYVNPRLCELTGYAPGEIIGKNSRILKSGYTSNGDYAELWKSITSGSNWRGELLNRKKDGTLFWEIVTISPIRNAEGVITHYLGIKEDITEKKRFEAELIRSKEKLEENDRLKTAFLHNISHEIRTPLNAIIGFSSLLSNRNLSEDKVKSFMDIIEASNEQLLSIISGIIALSSLEAGQEKAEEAPADLNEMIENVYRQFKFSLLPGRVDLSRHFGLPDDQSLVITDGVKLMQVVVNLVSNALKFTPQGSVGFGYDLVDNQLEFFVEDTGIGIPLDKQELIFERFRQLDDSPTRKYGGAGLGLALSKGYVELLGGFIHLQSAPDKGSRFSFSIPFKPVNSVANQAEAPVKEINLMFSAEKTILVAEDEDNNYMLIEEMLSNMNVKTVWARNGLEAVEECGHKPLPHLILMDIKMPEMDGIEATRQIKSIHPDIPVIALTAYAMDEDRKRILEAGCNDYIKKPVNSVQLKILLGKYLR